MLLRPLTRDDANAHLAGEDDELARWLNGGPGSTESVGVHIGVCIDAWRNGEPWRTFGIVDAASGQLAGSVDLHAALPTLAPGVVNLAYGVYPVWRGRGFAGRAIRLTLGFARAVFDAHTAVARIHPDNVASRAVARRCAFQYVGAVFTDEGRLDHYLRRTTASE